jgi:hypothetical protein
MRRAVNGLMAHTNYAVATNAASFFRVEHTRLYRGLGDVDYLGNLLDGFRSA